MYVGFQAAWIYPQDPEHEGWDDEDIEDGEGGHDEWDEEDMGGDDEEFGPHHWTVNTLFAERYVSWNVLGDRLICT